MTIKGSLLLSIAIVKAFLTRNFLSPVENWPKICVFWGKWGQNVKFCFRDTKKAHSCAKRRHLTYWSWKSVQWSRLLADRRTKKTSQITHGEFSRIWGTKGGNHILMKFCMGVGVHDVITHANLGDDRFRVFFEGAGVEFPTFPLTCVVVLKTLWHYCASVWFLFCSATLSHIVSGAIQLSSCDCDYKES